MEWQNVFKNKLPPESTLGTPVLVYLNTTKKRVYGNIVIAVYYKGKFHKDFSKGFILDITHWMPLPETPK